MLNSAIWKRSLLERKMSKPFVFLTGMRVSMELNTYCERHAHVGLEIVYHETGRGVSELDNESVAFDEGSVLMYGPGRVHDQSAETPTTDLCVHIMVPKVLGDRLAKTLYVPMVGESSLADEIRSLTVVPTPSDDIGQRILDCRVTALLLSLVQMASSTNEADSNTAGQGHVRRAEEFMRKHYAQIESIGEVAHHVGVSHDYLRHVFKAQRGRSIVHYLNEIRVAQAKLLLVHSPLPLKQIATACGFKDEYYFSAVFRKTAAISPGAYRTSQDGPMIFNGR